MRNGMKSVENCPFFQTFEAPKAQKSNGYLVKVFEFSSVAIINVDRSHMPSLSVKASFRCSHF